MTVPDPVSGLREAFQSAFRFAIGDYVLPVTHVVARGAANGLLARIALLAEDAGHRTVPNGAVPIPRIVVARRATETAGGGFEFWYTVQGADGNEIMARELELAPWVEALALIQSEINEALERTGGAR